MKLIAGNFGELLLWSMSDFRIFEALVLAGLVAMPCRFPTEFTGRSPS